MKPCDLPAAVFVQGWLMILAGIHQHLTDEVLRAAIDRIWVVASVNPRFEVSEEQAAELVGNQLLTLANGKTESEVRAFAQRCLRMIFKDVVSEN